MSHAELWPIASRDLGPGMGPPSASEYRCLKATASEGKLQSSGSFVARGLHRSGAHSPHLPVGAGRLSAPTPPFRLWPHANSCLCLSLAAGGHPFPPRPLVLLAFGTGWKGNHQRGPFALTAAHTFHFCSFDMTKKLKYLSYYYYY